MSGLRDELAKVLAAHQLPENQHLGEVRCSCGHLLWTTEGFTAGKLRMVLNVEDTAWVHHQADAILAHLRTYLTSDAVVADFREAFDEGMQAEYPEGVSPSEKECIKSAWLYVLGADDE